jgi:hypothetical protein
VDLSNLSLKVCWCTQTIFKSVLRARATALKARLYNVLMWCVVSRFRGKRLSMYLGSLRTSVPLPTSIWHIQPNVPVSNKTGHTPSPSPQYQRSLHHTQGAIEASTNRRVAKLHILVGCLLCPRTVSQYTGKAYMQHIVIKCKDFAIVLSILYRISSAHVCDSSTWSLRHRR